MKALILKRQVEVIAEATAKVKIPRRKPPNKSTIMRKLVSTRCRSMPSKKPTIREKIRMKDRRLKRVLLSSPQRSTRQRRML
jgi:hypothetical protein